MSKAIRQLYDSQGVEGYYSSNIENYENPHSKFAIDCLSNQWQSNFKSVIDFACGDGLISKYLAFNQMAVNISGCDKFMASRYISETGFHCVEASFEDIANFKINLPKVDVIVISYAIDLVQPSYLKKLLYALSCYADNLLVIRPNNHTISSDFWEEVSYFKSGKAKSFLYSAKK